MPESNRHAAGFELKKLNVEHLRSIVHAVIISHENFSCKQKKAARGRAASSGRKYSDTYSVTLRGEISV